MVSFDFIILLGDHLGIAAFAISGFIVAEKKEMDIFGSIVLATVTAVGGGTIRDILLANKPVFWIDDPSFLATTLIVSLVTSVYVHFYRLPKSVLVFFDAIGLSFFTVFGTKLALGLGVNGIIAGILGMITGVFGGVIRDVLAGEIPLIMKREIYATAALLGGVLYWLMVLLQMSESVAYLIAVLLIMTFRFAAIIWNMSLPVPKIQKG